MRVKICGITNLDDAINAINAGADALGFVFYEKSPRYIEAFEARKIIEKLPPFIQAVGLFVNESSEYINEVCINSKIQLSQIIDDDNYTQYDLLNVKYIKVLRAKTQEDIKSLNDDYILIDAFVDGFGGEGKRIALEWFENTDCSKIVLAGGLKSDNLSELGNYNFYGVDVSSGVEKAKGKKDNQKMIDFVKAANEI